MTSSKDSERPYRTRRLVPPAGFSTEMAPGVRSFRAPPSRLDLRTATATELARHGLPRRPDPASEPYLAARWSDVFGRSLTIDRAELGSRPRARSSTLAAAPPDYSVAGWAGVGRNMVGPNINVGDPYTFPATFVSAQWTLPEVMGDPSNLDEYLSIWVGLDGFPLVDEDSNDTGQGQVLRGGIRAVPNGQSFDWVGWAEWYSADYQPGFGANITNFPALSGDTVGVVVCVSEKSRSFNWNGTFYHWEVDSAVVFLANLSRGFGRSVGFTNPYWSTTGLTAEWIVEGGDPSISLPFSPITFEECVAGSTQEVFHLTPNGIITNMSEIIGLETIGPDVTQTSITSSTTAVVEWIGRPGG